MNSLENLEIQTTVFPNIFTVARLPPALIPSKTLNLHQYLDFQKYRKCIVKIKTMPCDSRLEVKDRFQYYVEQHIHRPCELNQDAARAPQSGLSLRSTHSSSKVNAASRMASV